MALRVDADDCGRECGWFRVEERARNGDSDDCGQSCDHYTDGSRLTNHRLRRILTMYRRKGGQYENVEKSPDHCGEVEDESKEVDGEESAEICHCFESTLPPPIYMFLAGNCLANRTAIDWVFQS